MAAGRRRPTCAERGYGRIVNVASIAGKEGNANSSACAAAKGGVIACTKSIAKELATSGVLVNCVAPTIAETELLQEMTPEFMATIKAKIPMARFLRIDEVAEMVAWIGSPACSFTTGFTLRPDGWPSHLLGFRPSFVNGLVTPKGKKHPLMHGGNPNV
jgi:2-dehydro-3-deoxy-L-rhamnonate dehydrogenase (NAD+)